MTQEHFRLSQERDRARNWNRWGPYLSERQWGTVREDYSEHGNSWAAFPHDQARTRAYRWGEDGLQGWSDRGCRLCFAPALWNGNDTILKERLFGLGGNEGNHGEDVKECYYYLDSTPTHSYTKALYKYPQARYPYTSIRTENQKLGLLGHELELADMGLFDEGRYFDVIQEVAKRSAQDILWRITVSNRGPEAAPIHVLPHVWLRNTWTWMSDPDAPTKKPSIKLHDDKLVISHQSLGNFYFFIDPVVEDSTAKWLFTENETNYSALGGEPNPTPYRKDAFHRYVVDGEQDAVSPSKLWHEGGSSLFIPSSPGTIRNTSLPPPSQRRR